MTLEVVSGIRERLKGLKSATSRVFVSKGDSEAQEVKVFKEVKWLQRELLTLSDGKRVEVVNTPNEAIVIPVTNDGHIVLAQRKTNAQEGKIITTAFTAADHSQTSESVEKRALAKLDITPGVDVAVSSVGKFNSWKYLTSESACFMADVPVSAADFGDVATISDAKTDDYVILSKESFYEAIDAGEITDLRTIVAVQFALAAWEQKQVGAQLSQAPFTPEERVASLLRSNPAIVDREIIDAPVGKDWFPREMVNGDVIVKNFDNQAQVIGFFNGADGKPEKIHFLVEPFLAQGKYTLTLPSGSIEAGSTGPETAVKEMKEETGAEVDPQTVVQITPQRYPLPLYLTVGSTVYEAQVTGKGEKVGGDEFESEQGQGFDIPITQIGDAIRKGIISDASVIAALLDWGRKHKIAIL